MNGFRHPATVIALLALFVALGGTTYAATSLPKNSVGTKQLTKNAVTAPKIKNGAVIAAKINPKGLTVPNALHATSADSATNASHATSATSATNASSAAAATNSSELGGHAASFYAPATLRSGQSESGDWGVSGPVTGFVAYEGVAFEIPLAASLNGPHVVFVSSGTTTNCPGVGSAMAGYLCVYSQGAANLFPYSGGGIYNSVGNPGADRYGFVLGFFVTPSPGWALGSWTVTAP